jgi:hypothetical protein
MPDALVRNARLRREGTRNLVAAALAAGVRRLIAQSIAWAYAPGPEPHREEDPLDLAAAGARGASVGAVADLERLTLASPPLEGIVLRYGTCGAPAPAASAPKAPLRSMSTPLRTRRCWRSIAARPAPTTSPRTTPTVRTPRRGAVLGWDPGFRSQA